MNHRKWLLLLICFLLKTLALKAQRGIEYYETHWGYTSDEIFERIIASGLLVILAARMRRSSEKYIVKIGNVIGVVAGLVLLYFSIVAFDMAWKYLVGIIIIIIVLYAFLNSSQKK
ncbi:hypothetical protein [Chitinophaga sp. MM2321]|uniref:hypothetical protein n=1 Tax=Chitinophaga sp. MM2321 TaxID=3137178 RepID=UPI0032D5ACE3